MRTSLRKATRVVIVECMRTRGLYTGSQSATMTHADAWRATETRAARSFRGHSPRHLRCTWPRALHGGCPMNHRLLFSVLAFPFAVACSGSTADPGGGGAGDVLFDPP